MRFRPPAPQVPQQGDDLRLVGARRHGTGEARRSGLGARPVELEQAGQPSRDRFSRQASHLVEHGLGPAWIGTGEQVGQFRPQGVFVVDLRPAGEHKIGLPVQRRDERADQGGWSGHGGGMRAYVKTDLDGARPDESEEAVRLGIVPFENVEDVPVVERLGLGQHRSRVTDQEPEHDRPRGTDPVSQQRLGIEPVRREPDGVECRVIVRPFQDRRTPPRATVLRSERLPHPIFAARPCPVTASARGAAG